MGNPARAHSDNSRMTVVSVLSISLHYIGGHVVPIYRFNLQKWVLKIKT